jgi:GxxExxY protein
MALLHEELTHAIIGACMEVHRLLGTGLNEVVYQDALAEELTLRGLAFAREVRFDVQYKGKVLPHYYFADFVVEGEVIVEVKAIETLAAAHERQTLNYLAISKLRVGLLVNFGERSLKWKRLIL